MVCISTETPQCKSIRALWYLLDGTWGLKTGSGGCWNLDELRPLTILLGKRLHTGAQILGLPNRPQEVRKRPQLLLIPFKDL